MMGPGREPNLCENNELVSEFEGACRGDDFEFAPEYRAEILRRLISNQGEAARLREALKKLDTYIDFGEPLDNGDWGIEDVSGINGVFAEAKELLDREALSPHTEDKADDGWGVCPSCAEDYRSEQAQTISRGTGIQKVREAVEAIEGEMIEVYGPKAERIRRRLDCIRSVLGITIPGITDSSDASSEHICGDCQEESNELVSGLCPECYAAWEEEGCLE